MDSIGIATPFESRVLYSLRDADKRYTRGAILHSREVFNLNYSEMDDLRTIYAMFDSSDVTPTRRKATTFRSTKQQPNDEKSPQQRPLNATCGLQFSDLE